MNEIELAQMVDDIADRGPMVAIDPRITEGEAAVMNAELRRRGSDAWVAWGVKSVDIT